VSEPSPAAPPPHRQGARVPVSDSPIMPSELTRGRLLALAAPVFWSITGVTVRSMEAATAWQINFYRSGTLALFVLAVLLVRYRRRTLAVIRAAGGNGMLAGGLVGMAMICNIVAMSHTTVANAVLLMASGPVVAAILGRVLLKEPVSGRTLLAILFAGVGMAVMVGGGVVAGSLFGDLIALVGVLFFGAYAIALRRTTHVDMTPAVFYAGAFGALVAAVTCFATGIGVRTAATDIALCVMLGIVQLGIGSVLFALASRHVPAAELTLFSLGEPVLAPLWTWLGVGEVPSLATLAGGAVMLAALAIQATARK